MFRPFFLSRRLSVRCAGLVLSLFALHATAAVALSQSLDELGVSVTSLRLQGEVVDTTQQRDDLALFVLEQPEAMALRRIIQLDGPMTPQRAEALEQAGVALGEYVPMHAYVADLSGADAARLAQIDFIRWHGAYESSWKVAPDLGQRQYDDPDLQALVERGDLPVVVSLFEGSDLRAAANQVQTIPGATVIQTWTQGRTPMLTATLPQGAVADLAEFDSVSFISNAQEATLRNSRARWIVQSNLFNVTPMYDNGIRGEGQIVGVMDGRVGASHCSFVDPGVPFGPNHRKIVAYNSSASPVSTHGTHVAGTAVGDGGSTNNTRGVAYMAKMTFNTTPGFQNQFDFVNRLTLHHNQGARIHTNSWGDDGTTAYTNWTRAIDVFSRDNEDSVVLLAITNLNSLRVPENAKSVLAVGASGSSGQQHLHCTGGQGPTSDGRRKPEVYAPGCGTNSSAGSSGCGTTSLTGTSMACPAVAGATALARQYFVDGFYPSGVANPSDALVPTGALLRATMMNSAVDMTGVAGYPSNREGWGRILLDNTLHFPGDSRTIIVHDVRNNSADALSTGGVNEHTFTVDSSSEQLRVTMSFTDVPANTFVSFSPINDINLEATSPSGAVYRGNVFAGGASVTGGSFDAVNSTEQIHVNNPETGQWTVRVIGAAVNQQQQGYGLVITGDVSEGAACTGDINGDGVVDGADLAILLANWGTSNPGSDLNGDNDVNGADLALLLANWGGC